MLPRANGRSVVAEIALARAKATATPPVALFENFATPGIITAATNGNIQIAQAFNAVALKPNSKDPVAII